MKRVICTAFAVCSFLLGVAHAAVTYDNAGSPADVAYYSDPGFGQGVADNFTLAPGQNVITDVHWTGAYANNTPSVDDFTIQFFADNGGLPAASPVYSFHINDPGHTDTGMTVYSGSSNVYSYSANINPTALSPSTPYWLSIFNATSDAKNRWLWASRFTGDTTDTFAYRFYDYAWTPETSNRIDFQLTNDGVPAVPEPSAYVLMLAGLGVVGFAVRRRQRNGIPT